MRRHLNNLLPFYIGQKVIYITGINMPKDSIHIVTDIVKYPCGYVNMCINGGVFPGNGEFNCVCGQKHNNKFSPNDNKDPRLGWDATSFRAVQEDLKLISYTRVLEEVLVGSN